MSLCRNNINLCSIVLRVKSANKTDVCTPLCELSQSLVNHTRLAKARRGHKVNKQGVVVIELDAIYDGEVQTAKPR